MPSSLRLEKPASKFIEKIKDKTLARRLLGKIEKLKENPFPSDAVRVEEYKEDKVFRVRAGDYRILYYVDASQALIVIIRIDKRSRAY
ncbi:MAG TPA: type II toxin-antitoxin system RelE/ParE family toxin [Candidatus Nanoarchaeia archaeon]|nr:type II toxin-antitoxin system RelE/ParE family toxin [Candidatus Nanoarchaeia archaeon]